MEASPLARRAPLGTLKPGRVSARRAVPDHIARPEYMFHDGPERVTTSNMAQVSPWTPSLYAVMSMLTMSPSSRGRSSGMPWQMTTDELDRIGHEYLLANDAYPSCLGYMGFPKSLCSSINEVICHGIPDDRPLEEGDIVNIDITAYKDGVHGDTCAMFEVGTVDEESHLLIERTKNAMMRGIKAVGPGREINVIGRVIEAYAKRFNYGVVRDYTGHGVGEAFHSGLIVPHYDAAPAYDTVMEPGMVFTIEPMLTLGTVEWEQWDDNWTIVTADRSRTAQFEHTIVVTEDGAEILTLP